MRNKRRAYPCWVQAYDLFRFLSRPSKNRNRVLQIQNVSDRLVASVRSVTVVCY